MDKKNGLHKKEIFFKTTLPVCDIKTVLKKYGTVNKLAREESWFVAIISPKSDLDWNQICEKEGIRLLGINTIHNNFKYTI